MSYAKLEAAVSAEPKCDPLIQERRSLAKPILLSFLLPLFIGLFAPSLIRPFIYLFCAAALLLPGVILAGVIYDWLGNSQSLVSAFFKRIQPLPYGTISGTDLKINSMPWGTLALVAANTLLFFALPIDTVKRGVFFPLGEPTLLHVAVSFFSSAFLHADIFHLLGNMLFLWVFGSVLEPRLGTALFLLIYLASIVVSHTFCLILLSLQALSLGTFEAFWGFHSLGASGAIAGLMGVFAVRAFFAKIKIAVPFLFIPFLSFPLAVQGNLLIGLFFSMDVMGGVGQFEKAAMAGVDYWAHIGGYVGGLAIGYLLKLHRPAAREASELNAERFAARAFQKKEAAGLYADILARDPQNEKALKYFCTLYRYNAKKRAPYLESLLQVLERKNFQEALSLFEENYPSSLQSASGDVLLKFGLHYLRTGDFMRASSCLETAGEKQGPWQAKALYSLAGAYEEMDQSELVAEVLEKVLASFPGTPIGRAAQKDLIELKVFKSGGNQKTAEKGF